MQQVALEALDPALHDQTLVHQVVGEARAPPAEDPQHAVGVPVAVADPLAAEAGDT